MIINPIRWSYFLLFMCFLLLNACESREERLRGSGNATNVRDRSQAKDNPEYHHTRNSADGTTESASTTRVGGEMNRLKDIEGNRLIFRDGRELILIGTADNMKTESYLRQAFENGTFQEPINFSFDSHHVPRRPERTTSVKAYATDNTGKAINGTVLKNKVSVYVREGVDDSTYVFGEYEKAEIAVKKGVDVDLLQSSTGQIRVFSDTGYPLGTGSGFFITANGTGVSNFHVFEGGSRFEFVRCIDGKEFQVTEIIDYNKEADFVVFKVIPDNNFLCLELASSDVKQGDQIYVYGSPRDLTCSITQGIVSAIRENGKHIQIDAAISPGNSGSPVVNENTEVVGIATFKRNDCENCNFAKSARFFAQYFSK